MRYLLVIILLTGSAFASCPASVPSGITNCFYIDYTSGVDTNDGLSEAGGHPWKNLPGMTGCASTCASNTTASGNGYILKGGTVWPYTAFPYALPSFTGSSSASYGCTGSGCVFIGTDPTWNVGTVLAVNIKRDLGGCASAPTVAFSGGGGINAAATAVLMPATATFGTGFVLYVTITNAGSGYTSNPSVTITGGSCTGITAVADITRPIFDYGKGTRSWSTGSFPNGPFFIGQNKGWTIFDSIEIRNFDVTASTGYTPTMFGSYNTKFVTVNNLYVHNMTQSTTTAGQEEGIDQISLNMNGSGNADTSLVSNNFVSNTEPTYLSNGTNNCFLTTGGTSEPVNTPCTYGSGGMYGGGTVTNNYVQGVRWMMRGASQTQLILKNNEMWLGLNSCCGGHANGVYLLPQTGTFIIHDNVIHDLAPGTSNLYLQMGNGTTWYLYNDRVWNIGQSTDDIGIDVTTGSGVGGGTFYVFNETFLALSGTGDCINNNAGTNSQFLTVIIQNVHCITTGGNLFSLAGAAVYKNFAGSTVTANINAASVEMTTANATTQGYVIANLFAPTATSNSTYTFASGGNGANLTSTTPGCGTSGLAGLCTDALGTARSSGSGSNWQAGAYWFGGVAGPIGTQLAPVSQWTAGAKIQ